MSPAEALVDDILSYELLGAVEEEAETLFWLDGRGGATAWRTASDDVRSRYIEQAKQKVANKHIEKIKLVIRDRCRATA